MRERVINPPVEIDWDMDEWADVAEELSEKSSIHVSSSYDPIAVALHEGVAVGAMFGLVSPHSDAYDGDDPVFSFDIVIENDANPAVKLAAFMSLIEAAKDTGQEMDEVYPGLRFFVHVVSPYAKPLLERAGFYVVRELGMGRETFWYMDLRD